MNATGLTVKASDIRQVTQDDPDPDTSYLDQDDFEELKAAYERGAFSYVGLWAEVEVWAPIGGGTSVRQVVRSGGLWGIEYRGAEDDGYLAEVFKEERAQLVTILEAMGMEVSE